jgi:L,D-transpeptidase ErfK/SrfK
MGLEAFCRRTVLAMLVIGGVASAAEYSLPASDVGVVGSVLRIEPGEEETYVSLAQHYDVGFQALGLANPGVDPWLPHEWGWIRIPALHVLPDAPRKGIVLNVPEMRLYYYPPPGADGSRVVHTYPISVGRVDWETPLGQSRVIAKEVDPSWHPPESVRQEHLERGDVLPEVVPPGPDNPLGRHAMRLNIPGYLIHGTNKPQGIGMRVTHGCIRMLGPDVEELFGMAPVGTPVFIVDQPIKSGWRDNILYVQAYPPLDGPLESGEAAGANLTKMTRVLVEATRAYPDHPIDWRAAQRTVDDSDGIPQPVTAEPVTVAHGAPQPAQARAGAPR